MYTEYELTVPFSNLLPHASVASPCHHSDWYHKQGLQRSNSDLGFHTMNLFFSTTDLDHYKHF